MNVECKPCNAGDVMIDPRTKGLPHGHTAISLSDVSKAKWNLLAEDLPLPVAVLRETALRNNRRWIREFLDKTNVYLAPHGKTTMSPALFALQIGDGAWGITLATVQQVRVARQAGIHRILLANQAIGPQDIEYLVQQVHDDPDFELFCLVDSLDGLRRLSDTAKRKRISRPLKVLVEVGYAGGRTGCRTFESALAIAQGIQEVDPYVKLAGIEGFEGLHQYLPAAEAVPRVCEFLKKIADWAVALDERKLFSGPEIMLSAGGSAYYDLVVEVFRSAILSKKTSIVLRSGCSLSHDAGVYERLFADILDRSNDARAVRGRFQNVIEIWAYVISVPEPGRAILGAGRRDFGHDLGAPVPLKVFRPRGELQVPKPLQGAAIVGINDQHAHMQFPTEGDFRVGDMVALGISHPCTTFDRWQLLYLTDDAYNITAGIQTHF